MNKKKNGSDRSGWLLVLVPFHLFSWGKEMPLKLELIDFPLYLPMLYSSLTSIPASKYNPKPTFIHLSHPNIVY
jgi:hypothetical protein